MTRTRLGMTLRRQGAMGARETRTQDCAAQRGLTAQGFISRRVPSRRILLAALGLLGAALLAGCGGASRSSETSTQQTVPETTTATTTAATTTPAPARMMLRVYLLRDGFVAPVGRSIEATPAVARAATEELIAGPTETERAAGLTSDVPADSRLLDLTIADGVATIDLSRAFAAGAEATISSRLAQVVYTLTQFPSVNRVRFEQEGGPMPVVTDGNGQLLSGAAARSDYEALTPPLLVESPLPGETVTSPLRISGTANAFEATFQAKVVGAAGKDLVHKTVMATSGSGQRGTFAETLTFADKPGEGRLVVWEDSAANGKPIHQVEIPLHLK